VLAAFGAGREQHTPRCQLPLLLHLPHLPLPLRGIPPRGLVLPRGFPHLSTAPPLFASATTLLRPSRFPTARTPLLPGTAGCGLPDTSHPPRAACVTFAVPRHASVLTYPFTYHRLPSFRVYYYRCRTAHLSRRGGILHLFTHTSHSPLGYTFLPLLLLPAQPVPPVCPHPHTYSVPGRLNTHHWPTLYLARTHGRSRFTDSFRPALTRCCDAFWTDLLRIHYQRFACAAAHRRIPHLDSHCLRISQRG